MLSSALLGRRQPLLGAVRSSASSRISARKPLTVTAAIRARWHFDVKWGKKGEAIQLLQEWVSTVGRDAGLTPSNARITAGLVGSPESRLELEVEIASLADLEAFWGGISPTAHKAWTQRAAHCIIDGTPTWEVLTAVPAFVDMEENLNSAAAAPVIPHSASSAPLRIQQPAIANSKSQQPRSQQPEPSIAPASSLAAPTLEELQRYASPSQSRVQGGAFAPEGLPGAGLRGDAALSDTTKVPTLRPGASSSPTAAVPSQDGRQLSYASNSSKGTAGGNDSDASEGAGSAAASGLIEMEDWKGDKIVFNPGDKIPFKF